MRYRVEFGEEANYCAMTMPRVGIVGVEKHVVHTKVAPKKWIRYPNTNRRLAITHLCSPREEPCLDQRNLLDLTTRMVGTERYGTNKY